MKGNQRSEEMHDIIEKMPTKFGLYITLFIVLLFSVVLTVGFVVDYPDSVIGSIQIRKGGLPIKVITKTSGNIKILIPLKDSVKVKQGEYLAYFENPTNVFHIRNLKKILETFQKTYNYKYLDSALKRSPLQYGELTVKVNQLQGITQKILLFKRINVFKNESLRAKNSLIDQKNLLNEMDQQIKMRNDNLLLAKRMFSRDSVLFSKDLISQLEYEKSNQVYLSNQESVYNLKKEALALQQKFKEIQNQDTLANVQMSDKNQDLSIQFNIYLHDVLESIKDWELRYVVVCPITGTLSILKYLEENEFVKSGEEIFAVTPPLHKNIDGIISISSSGAGKIRKDQKVIVKLADFPYREFGTLEGRVKSIAAVSKTATDANYQTSDIYLITVSFPSQSETNFGSVLGLQSGVHGTAEIITNNRNLMRRIFQNVKYSTNKY